jgi:ABC-2 type transport system ATP-binding protein
MGGLRPSKNELIRQLERVGLADRAFSKVFTFSQGMKQRLGIAVALVNDPSVIILDEPTNGLDPQGIADARNLILDLGRNQKKTILVSSHLLSEVELIASHILIIDRGKKMVEGNVKDLFDPSRMVVEFQALDPSSAMLAIQESKWRGHLSRRQNGHFILKMTKSDIPLFTGEMIQKGVQIVLIQPRHSLEDYFLSLTAPNQHVDPFAN